MSALATPADRTELLAGWYAADRRLRRRLVFPTTKFRMIPAARP